MGLEFLIKLLSSDFVLHHETFLFLRDKILMLRSVNSKLKRALHDDTNVSLNIRVGQSVLSQLNQDFLFSWKGTLFLYIEHVKPDILPWLQSLAAVLASGSTPRLGLLDLGVAGQNLPPLVDLLVAALADPRLVQLVTLRYGGSSRPMAAARLAALQAAVPTEVIAAVVDDTSADMLDGLSALHGSGVAVRTLELRLVPTPV